MFTPSLAFLGYFVHCAEGDLVVQPNMLKPAVKLEQPGLVVGVGEGLQTLPYEARIMTME